MKDTIIISILLGLLASCGTSTNSNNSDDNSADTVQSSIVFSDDTVTNSDETNPDKFWADSYNIDSIKSNLKTCYQIALTLQTKQGQQLDNTIDAGRKIYLNAGSQLSEIINTMPKDKEYSIQKILQFYKEVFNPSSLIHNSDFTNELEYINTNLLDWPVRQNQMELDFSQGVERYFVYKSSSIKITLPTKGSYCIWNMVTGDRMLYEGNLPNKEYGKYDISKDDLPLYLAKEKTFSIYNPSFENEIILTVQPCELEK